MERHTSSLSHCTQATSLAAAAPVIAPSLLQCDFGNLAEEVRSLQAAGAKALHLDVMDGHFVPNLTYGLPIVEAVRRVTELPLDVHLMIDNPGQFLEAFHKAGASLITIHVEATSDPKALLAEIRSLGACAGLALNPQTPLESVLECLSFCDQILVMSVHPGFGGQEFNPVALEKLFRLREEVNPGTLLEVDGGVNASTIRRCAEAGAQMFVVGSAIFRQPDYARSIGELTALASL